MFDSKPNNKFNLKLILNVLLRATGKIITNRFCHYLHFKGIHADMEQAIKYLTQTFQIK